MPQDNDLIEQLNHASLRSFIALACREFCSQTDVLIERVFRKDDFVLKSVVDSLFEHQGPLADFAVRLKLLLGLGVISTEIYQDLHAFLDFKHQLSDQIDEPTFFQPETTAFIRSLHSADISLIEDLISSRHSDNPESMLYQMQQLRLEKMLRSCLIIAVSEMLEKLNVESPL